MTNEAFARVNIDALLAAQGGDTLSSNAVRFEVQLPDRTRADDLLCDPHGRSLAVIQFAFQFRDPLQDQAVHKTAAAAPPSQH